MSNPKRKTKALSLNEKVDILRDIASGVPRKEICSKYDTSNTNISKIIKKKDTIEEDFQKYSGNVKRKRACTFPQLDSALLQWFTCHRAANVPLSGPLLQEKANEFAHNLNLGLKSEITMSWVSRFKERHGIKFRTVCGESGAVNLNVTSDWINHTWPLIKGNYNPVDIFNADECGLFYKLLPQKSLAFKGEKCTGGKNSKERVTVLVCANADGTEKLKPLVIGKSRNPRCFKNIRLENLPVEYEANKKAWMTADIFSNFCIKWDQRLRKKSRNILLLLDNCSAHPQSIPNLKNIKIVFLPPNTTSQIQPMDAGVIKNLKHFYRKEVLRKQIHSLDAKEEFKIDIKEAILLISHAWNSVTPGTIQNCFFHTKVCSQKENVDEAVTTVDNNESAAAEFEILRAKKLISDELTFEEYVNADVDLLTCDLPTDEDIVNIVACSNSNTHEDTSEDEVAIDLEESSRKLSRKEALAAINDLTDFALSSVIVSPAVSEKLCDALTLLQLEIHQSSVKALKQSTITQFFQSLY